MNAWRMRRPSALRIGMFCRFGIGGRQPAGGRDRLVIAGVHAAGVGIDLLRQFLGVGGAQLGEAAILENHARQRIAVGQLLQHVLGGGGRAARGLAQHRQLQPLEQHLLQLLGRIEIERRSGFAMRLGLDLASRREISPLCACSMPRSISTPWRSMRCSTGTSGCSISLVQPRQRSASRSSSRPQRAVQPQCHVGVLGRVFGGALDADLVEADLLGALAGDVLEVNGAQAQVVRGHRIHVVAGGGAVEHVRLEHGVVALAAQLDAVVRRARGCRT